MAAQRYGSPTFAGGDGFQPAMADFVERAFPNRVRRLGGWRQHSNGDKHEKGRALDIYADAATMVEIAYWLKTNVPNSRAIIHAGCGDKCSILDGHPWNYPQDMAAHHDHVHWDINSLADIGGTPGPAGGGAPAPAAPAPGGSGVLPAGFAGNVNSPAWWLRFAMAAGGVLIVLVGSWVLVKDTPIASAVEGAVPVGRLAKAAGALS